MIIKKDRGVNSPREVTKMFWFFASLLLLPVRLILGSTQGILLHLLMAIGLGVYVLGR